ncbi:L-serine ammonia-lyase, iron-sulfur-dependent subunit beta [Marinithermus hydrothermalis]|nr:L-serine ammonia-lyase, iron-sulfur-dependent subunit beta [Marinithermus hydrothermalis]
MSLLDMIGPVMVGPSSSHTAGACRIALLARHMLQSPPKRVVFDLHGSFAKTGKGHGTHLALAAGVQGMRPDDPRLPQSLELAEAAGLEIHFRNAELGDVHPNTVRITLENDEERVVTMGSSLGGGIVRIFSIDGFEVRVTGQAPTLLIKNVDTPGVIARVARVIADDEVNIAYLTCARQKRGGEAMMSIEVDRDLSQPALDYLNHLSYILWVRMLPQVAG